MSIKRVLIANRGEIAVRVARACRTLGVESVLACSEADRTSLAAGMVDRVVCIGPAPAAQSYPDAEAVVTAAMSLSGHAIECRINAEEASAGFMPCPGAIVDWREPQAPGVRIDSHCYPGYVVPPYYDSMLGKLIVRGRDRHDAIENTLSALGRFVIDGIHTTLPLSRAIVADADFRRSAITTGWLEQVFLPRYLDHSEAKT